MELIKLINYLKELLASERMLLNVIRRKCCKVKEQFADARANRSRGKSNCPNLRLKT